MTEQTETTPAAAPAEKLTISNMPARRVFESTEEATAFLTKCQAELTDFADHPIAPAGFDADANFDPAIYDDSMDVAIARLTERGEGVGTSTVKAIVIYPSPKLDSVLADDAGREWLTAIMQKELNHVAVRGLRKAATTDDILEAIEQMPVSLAEFISSGRESNAGILEAYTATWQAVKSAMGQKSKAFSIRNFSKKELRKAMDSASYAAALYPELEDRVNAAGEKQSLLALAAGLGSLLCKKQGLDSSIYDKMIESREANSIDIGDEDDEEEDFDLDAMAAAMAPEADDSEAPAEDNTGTDAS